MNTDQLKKEIESFTKKLEESAKIVKTPEKAPGAPEKAKEKPTKAKKFKLVKTGKTYAEGEPPKEKPAQEVFPSLSVCPIEKFEEVKNYLIEKHKKGKKGTTFDLVAVANKFEVKYDDVLKHLWASIQQVDIVKPVTDPKAGEIIKHEVDYSDFEKKLAEVVSVFVEASKDEGISVPDDPVTVTISQQGDGWKAKVWSGPKGELTAVFPPPDSSSMKDLVNYMLESLSQIPATPKNPVMEKLAIVQLQESLGNMQSNFNDFVLNMSALLDVVYVEPLPLGEVKALPEPKPVVIETAISLPIALTTKGNFLDSDFSYLPLPGGFTELVGIIFSGVEPVEIVQIQIWAGEKSFQQTINIFYSVQAYDFPPYLNQKMFKGVAGIKVKAMTEKPQKLTIEFKYKKEV